MPGERRLQNSDFKTEADLGSPSGLLNDTKVYVTGGSINKRLDQAIIDGDIGGVPTFEDQAVTLNATQIANEYLDLAFEAADKSVRVNFEGKQLRRGIDFTTSVVAGPVTRVNWSAGEYGLGGMSELQENDLLFIEYVRA